MEQITRNVFSAMRNNPGLKVHPPLIVDGDTGYGGSPNMLRTISALASAGAAAITIEDQSFPKKCTIAAGEKIRIVEREEAVQRVRGALRARDLHCARVSLSTCASTSAGAGCWIVARTDCRLAFGFKEVVERCLRFEELGAEIVYAENLQSIDEYLKLREKLDRRTVTMVAQVQETAMRPGLEKQREGKPLLDTKKIGELGYDLALFGVTPLQCVIGSLMSAADQFYQNNGLIESNLEVVDKQPSMKQPSMIDFEIVKQVVGFDELEDFERTYPCG
jgi:2-methylisocitrate lyase-like PEP mutase family enzyme